MMNIAQLSEQLKDVPQNRLIDYARNPNSVVPQFLALAEIQRRQHLSAQAQPPAATVAEDVLAQAAPQMPPQLAPQMVPQQMAQQLPENQPGVAQLPTGMPQGMASGGIVAFASGDLVDDEEEYDSEERQAQREENKIRSLIAGMRARVGDAVASVPRAVQAIKSVLPESYESARARTEFGIASMQSKGAHPYESVALDEAKRLGLDPSLVRHVLQKETGGLKDPATARSKAGAYGPMQLMPGTARDLGVDIADPEQNTRGGVRYLAQMMDKFKDPTLALAAYNAGPGRVQQMLRRGHGIESLKPETQNYVKFSQGGIASFAGPYGSLVEDSYSDHPNWLLSRSGVTGVNPYNAPSPVAPSVPQPSVDYDFNNMDIGFGKGKFSADAELEQAGPPRLSYAQEAMARIAQGREDVKAQAEQDKYLSLLQAGLGMMSGTSPYAMANIGQGGMQGVAAYAAAKKQRAAELASLGKEELSVQRLKQLAEESEATRELTAATRKAETERKTTAEVKRTEEKYIDDYNTFIQNITKRAAQSVPTKDINGLPIDPEERIRLIQQEEVRLFKQNEKILKNLAERARIPMPDYSEPAPRMTAPVKKEEPGFFSKLFGGNKPSSGAVDTRNPLLQ